MLARDGRCRERERQVKRVGKIVTQPGHGFRLLAVPGLFIHGSPLPGEIAMLVLTRKEGESIIVGNDVKITVSRIKGDKVKLGVEAPRSTRVVRSELLTRETPSHEPE